MFCRRRAHTMFEPTPAACIDRENISLYRILSRSRDFTHLDAIGGQPAVAERAELGLRSARDWPQQLHSGPLKSLVAARFACASLAWSHRSQRTTILRGCAAEAQYTVPSPLSA